MRLFQKTLLASATLTAALLFSGCDRSNDTDTAAVEPVAAQTSSEAAAVETAPTPAPVVATNNVTAEAIVQQVMSSMASALEMANKMAAEENKGEAKFSQEQIKCFVTKDNDMAVEQIQAYLEQSFSAAELTEMDDFYKSAGGQKQIEMTQKLIDSLMGGEQFDIATMEKSMSQEEIAAVSGFWESPTGTKLQQALSDRAALTPFMEPFIEAKQQHCDMPK